MISFTKNSRILLNPEDDNSPFSLTKARAGLLLTITSDTTVSENIRTLGHWAWDHIEIFKILTGSEGTFVDVGSYIGHHSVAMLNFLQGKGFVVSLEGHPQMAEICAFNMQMQNFDNWVVIESLISNDRLPYELPYEEFTESHNFGSLSLIKPQSEFGEAKFKVMSETLDAALQGFDKIDLIKMDVQYAELFAIQGSQFILQKFFPHLFIEIAPRAMKEKANYDYRSIYHLLIGLGYRIFDVLGCPISHGRNSSPELYGPDIEWDIVAIHESKLNVLKRIPWIG